MDKKFFLARFYFKNKYKVVEPRNEAINKVNDKKRIITILIIIFIIFFLYLKLLKKEKIIKKLKIENGLLRNKLDIKIKKLPKKEYKDTKKIVSKYLNQLINEYDYIQSKISSENYTFDINDHIKDFINKLNNIFLKRVHGIANDTILKRNYFKIFENNFNKYEKENIESNENKNKLRQYILNYYSSLFRKEIKQIDTIVYTNLGNALFIINNLIYFCEILNCKNIYLSKFYFFIKKPIYSQDFGITISPYNDENICNNDNTICITERNTFDQTVNVFKGDFFIPVRNYIFKEEFLSNIKLIETKEEDLYINIRSGEDIFKNRGYSPGSYFQPPLCFYQTIIENFNFSNIYIISNGKENPIIEELLNLYKNIKYIHGTIEEDASMIISAKNLVLPVSSFPIELIKFSDNLKNLFIFDFITDGDRRFWHFTDKHLRPCKYNRFIMYPNKEYVNIMFPWGQKDEQFKRMISEKCNKKFKIIPSDFI